MQFKYPEILYALLLLLIPIFIHLFQLRRFEKVAFTNVAFLKKVELQTRKSARLKKFLILLTRLGLFAALILAFAQPYFSQNKKQLQPKIALYLDNSLSMQAKDGTNELFKNAIQKIISNFNENSSLTVITNDNVYEDLNNKELKNQLLSLKYSPFSKDLNTVLLQANNKFKKNKNTQNHLLLISDFQSKNIKQEMLLNKDIQYSFVQLKPQNPKNISIDSVFIEKQNGLDIHLKVRLKSYNAVNDNLPVSLYKDQILTAKTSIALEKNKTNEVHFKIPFTDSFNGKIHIDDSNLAFDNDLFFSINKLEKINVLAIGEKNQFLTKIYSKTEFNFTNNKLNQVDYNSIAKQHLIVLNELRIIPISLQETLKKFVKNGGSLVFIPSVKANLANYNQFFNSLKMGSVNEEITAEHSVNSINFSHPILNNVFEKRIKNFQYPTVKTVYATSFKNQSAILKLDNQQAFVSEIKSQKGKVYWFASAINQQNANFKNSPLIVPIFYNFGKQSFQISSLYYTIGKQNKITVKTTINKDEVLKVSSLDKSRLNEQFIPLQRVYQQKVVLEVDENPLVSGFYQVVKNNKTLQNLAFNYDREESETAYSNLESIKKQYPNIQLSSSIQETFQQLKENYQVKSYWKWFVLLAILFLIIEVLLIKFLKK